MTLTFLIFQTVYCFSSVVDDFVSFTPPVSKKPKKDASKASAKKEKASGTESKEKIEKQDGGSRKRKSPKKRERCQIIYNFFFQMRSRPDFI